MRERGDLCGVGLGKGGGVMPQTPEPDGTGPLSSLESL